MNENMPVKTTEKNLPKPLDSGTLQVLLHNIDQLKPDFLSFSDHAALSCDAHTKEYYIAMLAAICMADKTITDNEARLLYLLQISMGLTESSQSIFDLAHSMGKENLKDFFRAIKENSLEKTFMLDALIIARIDGTIKNGAAALLSETAELMDIETPDITNITNLACHILGIPNETPIPSDLDQQFYAHWHPFLFKKLSLQDYQTGKAKSDGKPYPDPKITAVLTSTVIDEKTGLQWMRCSMGQEWNGTECIGDIKIFRWDDAFKAEAQLNREGYAGYQDWRLPTQEELMSIVDTNYSPTIDPQAFPSTLARYYLSVDAYNNDCSKGVRFSDGRTDYNGKNDGYPLRLVRTA